MFPRGACRDTIPPFAALCSDRGRAHLGCARGLSRHRLAPDRGPAARPGHRGVLGRRQGPSHHRRGGLGRPLPARARSRDGPDASLRLDDLRVRPARPRQHLLRPDHAGARAGRFGPALLRFGPVGPRHVPDLRLRLEGAEGQVDPEAREGGGPRLLRPHRARLRLQSRRNADHGEKGRRLLRSQRREGLDHERLDRRRRPRLGEARRRRARVPRREGHEGLLDVRAQGQDVAPRLGHVAARLRRLPHPRREHPARRRGPEGSALLPDAGALRDRLGGPRQRHGRPTAPRSTTRRPASSGRTARSRRTSSCRNGWRG